MPFEVLQQINYHSARAQEELSRAEVTYVDGACRSYLALYKHHLDEAAALRLNLPFMLQA